MNTPCVVNWEPLDRLIDGASDQVLSPDQWKELSARLVADPQACDRYIERMAVHRELAWQLMPPKPFTCEELDRYAAVGREALRGADRGRKDAGHRQTSPSATSPIVIQAGSASAETGFFPEGMLIGYSVASVVMALGLCFLAIIPVSNSRHATKDRTTPSAPVRVAAETDYVARITGMDNCRWADAAAKTVEGASVAKGRTYALVSGLLEITYFSGAKVLLQGPVTYEVDSAMGGYLSVGKLTARVEAGAEGGNAKSEIRNQKSELSNPQSPIPNPQSDSPAHLSPAPLFSVTTPTATITDLGTEFGIDVDKQGATLSHVFRGLVRIERMGRDRRPTGTAQIVREDESVRVEARSGDGPLLVVSTAKPADFIRAIPKVTFKTLDLVDIVAGGDGLGKARDRGIDPTTGRIVYQQPLDFDLQGDGQYHTVDELPFVDGVFIPSSANGPVQLDSAGHKFADFPSDRGNLTWGHLWAGGQWPRNHAGDLFVNKTRLLYGLDYSSPWHSMLGMHANKGITFDLAAIRKANPGCNPLQFSTIAGRCGYGPATDKVDVWVFVDGQVRFHRDSITDENGEVNITIPLNDQSNFLTLVVTDGGDNFFGDLFLFGDPKLVLINRPTTTKR
jgi:hypothetical protein